MFGAVARNVEISSFCSIFTGLWSTFFRLWITFVELGIRHVCLSFDYLLGVEIFPSEIPGEEAETAGGTNHFWSLLNLVPPGSSRKVDRKLPVEDLCRQSPNPR